MKNIRNIITVTLLCAVINALNATHAAHETVNGDEFSAIGCKPEDDYSRDLAHNIICLGTFEGSSYDGFTYGLPHYLTLFNLTDTNKK
jgi:hypothetical protein